MSAVIAPGVMDNASRGLQDAALLRCSPPVVCYGVSQIRKLPDGVDQQVHDTQRQYVRDLLCYTLQLLSNEVVVGGAFTLGQLQNGAVLPTLAAQNITVSANFPPSDPDRAVRRVSHPRSCSDM
jgi:hypothetical protein